MPDRDKWPSFPIYARAWLSGGKVRVTSLAGQGFFMNIACGMWISDAPGYLLVPKGGNEGRFAASLAGVSPQKARNFIQTLSEIGWFSRDSHGVLFSPKLVSIAAEYRAYRHKRSEAGKLGARARWQDKQADDAIAIPVASQSHRNRIPKTMRPECPVLVPVLVRTEEKQQRCTYRVELNDAELLLWLPQQAAAFLESKGTEKATAFCRAIRDGVDRYGADAVKLGLRTFADRCYPSADIRNAVAFVQPILKEAYRAWVRENTIGVHGDAPKKRSWLKPKETRE